MNVGQTGSARFTCVAQFCLLSLGGRVLSLQHCESCLDKTELDWKQRQVGLSESGVFLPHAAAFLSPGSL